MRCPYDEFSPHTLEGWQVWELLRDSGGQLRIASNGTVAGLDVSALLAICKVREIDRAAAIRLLAYAEFRFLA